MKVTIFSTRRLHCTTLYCTTRAFTLHSRPQVGLDCQKWSQSDLYSKPIILLIQLAMCFRTFSHSCAGQPDMLDVENNASRSMSCYLCCQLSTIHVCCSRATKTRQDQQLDSSVVEAGARLCHWPLETGTDQQGTRQSTLGIRIIILDIL